MQVSGCGWGRSGRWQQVPGARDGCGSVLHPLHYFQTKPRSTEPLLLHPLLPRGDGVRPVRRGPVPLLPPPGLRAASRGLPSTLLLLILRSRPRTLRLGVPARAEPRLHLPALRRPRVGSHRHSSPCRRARDQGPGLHLQPAPVAQVPPAPDRDDHHQTGQVSRRAAGGSRGPSLSQDSVQNMKFVFRFPLGAFRLCFAPFTHGHILRTLQISLLRTSVRFGALNCTFLVSDKL